MPDRRFWRCHGRVEHTRKNGRVVLVQRWTTPCLCCREDIVVITGSPRGDQPSVPFQRTLCNRCSRIDAAEKKKATWSAKRQALEAAKQAKLTRHHVRNPAAASVPKSERLAQQRAAQLQAAAPTAKHKTPLQKMIDGDYNRPYADDDTPPAQILRVGPPR
jgi:hypothetical protein